jgi:hypothetical protein
MRAGVREMVGGSVVGGNVGGSVGGFVLGGTVDTGADGFVGGIVSVDKIGAAVGETVGD